jgi:hypothetical protein
MLKRISLTAIGGLVLAVMLAACGSSSDDNSADEDQITDAITLAATSGDPAACTKVQTAKFTQQTSGEPGGSAADAVKSCEKDAADAPGDTIDVTDIEVDGDTATAKGAITGSFFDGQTLNINLVKDGDQWKLDEIPGFDTFDRDAFTAAFDKELTSGDEPATPEQASCVDASLAKLSDEQVEAFFLGLPGAPNGDEIFGPCFQGQGT